MARRPRIGSKTPVLFISSAEEPGADTFIHVLIMRSLDLSDFEVHVACPHGQGTREKGAYTMLAAIPDVRLRPTHFGPSLTGRSRIDRIVQMARTAPAAVSLAGLARYIRHHRIAIVHSTDRPRDAVTCALLGRITGAKSIIHAHLKCADWMGRSLRRSMARVDGLIGVSRFVASSLVDQGYAPEKTHAVLNAIDLSAWDYRLSSGSVRHDLGVAADAPVIACAARLFRGKGQDDLIRAVPFLRDEFPGLRLLIIGRDDRHAMATSFTEELTRLADDLCVREHVIFTGHRGDMPALMAACDVFALPSWEEPFGLVFAEAMAMKKPVVGLDNGGPPEIVDHGKSGLLCVPGSLPSLVEHLRTLLRDPALRARFGEYGRRQVEARFTMRRMGDEIGHIYRRLTAPPSHDRVAMRREIPTV